MKNSGIYSAEKRSIRPQERRSVKGSGRTIPLSPGYRKSRNCNGTRLLLKTNALDPATVCYLCRACGRMEKEEVAPVQLFRRVYMKMTREELMQEIRKMKAVLDLPMEEYIARHHAQHADDPHYVPINETSYYPSITGRIEGMINVILNFEDGKYGQ